MPTRLRTLWIIVVGLTVLAALAIAAAGCTPTTPTQPTTSRPITEPSTGHAHIR